MKVGLICDWEISFLKFIEIQTGCPVLLFYLGIIFFERYLGYQHNCGSNDFSLLPHIAIAPNGGRFKLTQVTDKVLLEPYIMIFLKEDIEEADDPRYP